MSKYKDKLLSTKLLITFVIIGISSIFVILDKITSWEWVISVLFVSIAYMIGNIVSASFSAFNVEANFNGDTNKQDKE